jgi:MFS family permease
MRNSTIRAGLRTSTIEGAWATAHGTLTTGAFLTGFALYLRANDLHLGLLMAIPLLAQTAQVAGAWLVQRTGWRKPIVAWASVFSRSLWLLMALIPFLARAHRMEWFLAGYLLSSVAMNLAVPLWTVWMSDLVPESIRGRYFGFRNRISGLITMASSLGAGLIVDGAIRAGHEYAGYLILFAAATLAGLMAFVYIRRQPEPGYRPEPVGNIFRYLVLPLRDPLYRSILLFYMLWLIPLGLAAPFFTAHVIKNLRWSFSGLAALNIIATVFAILFHPFWGRLIDRYGHRPVLRMTTFGLVPLPLIYAFCPYSWTWPIYLDAALAGLLWSGYNLAIFSILMFALPRQARPIYVAMAAAAGGLISFAASVAGGWLAETMSGWSYRAGIWTFVNYQVLFLLTALLRVPGFLMLRHIQEPGAYHTAVLIRESLVEVNRLMGVGWQVLILPFSRRRARSGPPPTEPGGITD